MNTSKTYLKKKSLVSFISFILFIAISFSNLGGLFQSKVSAATNGYVNSSVTTSLNVRSRASTASSIVTKITAGQRVTILAEVAAESDDTSSYSTWYKIEVNGNTGFVASAYVSYDTAVSGPATSDADFEAMIASFPESYKPYLRALHEEYPNWVFVPHNTNITWNRALDIQTASGVSLIPGSSDDSWKSKESFAYNPATGEYTVVDSPNWVNASRGIVAYYMDPRNCLSQTAVFQFLDLRYTPISTSASDYETQMTNLENSIETILTNTYMSRARGTAISYTGADYIRNNATVQASGYSWDGLDLSPYEMEFCEVFAQAAQESCVNPIFLAARAIQECGSNGSTSSLGRDSTYPHIYNFYNIGAYSDAVNAARRGLGFAAGGYADQNKNDTYRMPWNTQGGSICGGARWIYDYYVNAGQNTIYYMRFDVAPNGTGSLGDHQYMTATQSATSEATRMFNAYKKSGLLDSALTFYIPVYNDMPSTACLMPTSSHVAREYINRTFQVLLHREPTTSERDSFVNLINNGVTLVNAAAAIIGVPEFQSANPTFEDRISAIYMAMLNRAPAQSEIESYLPHYNNGYGDFKIFEIVANSQEARNYASANFSLPYGSFVNTDVADANMTALKPFVERLYSGFLNRTADYYGLRNWVTQLGSGAQSGPQVASGFFYSQEFQGLNLSNEEFVTRLYNVCLGRDPDPNGFNNWLAEIGRGATREFVFAGFVNSPEFLSFCRANGVSEACYIMRGPAYGTPVATPTPTSTPTATPTPVPTLVPNNEAIDAFVTRLYNLTLERDPDEAGFTHWTTPLYNLQSTGYNTAFGFVFSPEMESLGLSNEEYVTRMYRIFLNREPDINGFNDWVGQMNNGASRMTIFEGFVYSEEYINMCLDAGIVPNDNYSYYLR